MIKKFENFDFNEDWEEDEPTPIFNIGDDRVKCQGEYYYYSNNNFNTIKPGEIQKHYIGTPFWKSDRNTEGIIKSVDYCENVKGCTGQIILIKGKWPWFQSTNFKIINV